MWEGWATSERTPTSIEYCCDLELTIDTSRTVIELTVRFQMMLEPLGAWQVVVLAGHRLTGDYQEFIGIYSTYDEAERIGWQQANRSISIREEWSPRIVSSKSSV